MKKYLSVIPFALLGCLICCQEQVEEVVEEPAVDIEADVQAISRLNDEWDVASSASI